MSRSLEIGDHTIRDDSAVGCPSPSPTKDRAYVTEFALYRAETRWEPATLRTVDRHDPYNPGTLLGIDVKVALIVWDPDCIQCKALQARRIGTIIRK